MLPTAYRKCRILEQVAFAALSIVQPYLAVICGAVIIFRKFRLSISRQRMSFGA